MTVPLRYLPLEQRLLDRLQRVGTSLSRHAVPGQENSLHGQRWPTSPRDWFSRFARGLEFLSPYPTHNLKRFGDYKLRMNSPQEGWTRDALLEQGRPSCGTERHSISARMMLGYGESGDGQLARAWPLRASRFSQLKEQEGV
ncbi:hypothetical protein [Paraburkholderia sp. CI3]|uniref:hypothetical protein n=1 Tax=Paraburkholderia sp. CI3 TaxID=2991060 RepID=UPI003D1C6294